MKVDNVKPYKYLKHHTIEDEECNIVDGYGEAKELQAYIYPGSGKAEIAMYGVESKYILKLLTNEDVLEELDGVCVYSESDPDYKVISVNRYSEHLEIDLKKI